MSRCPACQRDVPLLVEGTDMCMACDLLIDPPDLRPIPLRLAIEVRRGLQVEDRPVRRVMTDEQRERKNAARREKRALARRGLA